MLPPIGSVSTLPSHGRTGVIVDARPLGEAEGGRQLVAVRIKAEKPEASESSAPTAAAGRRPAGVAAGNGGSSGQSSAPSSAGPVAAKLADQLSAAERADVANLQQRDQQVRQEEKAHAAVAGDLAGPITYSYQQGPDGRQYAVGGSVSIRAQTFSGDPEEAKRLSGRMAAAANAATNPSAQDLATARQAYAFGSQTSASHQDSVTERGLDITL